MPLDEYGSNRSLLKKIGSRAAGVGGAIVNTLDLIPSSGRDILAGLATGNWSKHNPLDQFATPFSDINRTSGRDLNRSLGLAGRRDTTANWWGGLATEIATDPLTYLTFGGSALGKAGKVAKLAGLTDDLTRVAAKVSGKAAGSVGKATARLTTTPAHLISHGAPDALEKLTQAATKQGVNLADVMHEPMGGLTKFWPTGTVLGTGKTAQKVAGLMDTAGSAIRFGKYSPVAPVARLFDAPTKDALNPIQAAAGKRAFQLEEAARAGVREKAGKFANELVKSGLATESHGPLIREVLEGVRPITDLPTSLHSTISEWRQSLDAIPAGAKAVGRKIREYTDPQAKYAPRFMTAGGRETTLGGAHFGTEAASQLSRKPYYFGIKGGTEAINRIGRSVAPLVESKASPKVIAAHLKQNFAGVIPPTFVSNADRARIAAAQAAGIAPPAVKRYKTFKALASTFSKKEPELLKQGLFGNHPLADTLASLTANATGNARAQAIVETLTQPGVLKQVAEPGSVRVSHLLSHLGMEDAPAIAHLVAHHVPGDMAEYLAKLNKGFDVPQSVGHLLGKLDTVTNLTKLGLTSPWLNFQIRNLSSGQFNNFLSGMFSPHSVHAAHDLYKGGIVAGAAQIPEVQRIAAQQGLGALSDQAATDILRQLSFAHEVASKHEGQAFNMAGNGLATNTLHDILGELPGVRPNNPLGGIASAYAGRGGATWNPLKATVRGLAGAKQSTFAPLAGGEALGHYVESLNRLAPFIHRLQQGATAAQAAKEVGEAQVKYAARNYTKFEQQLMSRLFPFFKFTRGMMPYLGKQLIEQPGGKLAQTLRAVNEAHSQDETLPEHITETTAIPFPGAKDGNQRFLTGLGLSFEDPAQLVTPDLKSAGNELLSRSNPLLKGTLEAITGRSFFQRGPGGEGRPMADLDPSLGRTLANVGQLTVLRTSDQPVRFPGSGLLESVVSNSPLSKAVMSARIATDLRKGPLSKAANLTTGLRIADVSPQAKEAALKRQVDDLLAELGARRFSESYYPKDRLEGLSPSKRALVENLLDLKRGIDKQRKAKAKNK